MADVKISGLPVGVGASGPELVPAVQGGTTSQLTVTQLLAGGAHARSTMLKPTAALYENMDRGSFTPAVIAVLLSGRLDAIAIGLPSGITVTSITFVSATTAASAPTHQWFGLANQAGVALRFTGDDTNNPWAGSTAKTLNLSSPFVTTYAGLYYVMLMVTAGTVPTFYGITSGTNAVSGLTPTLQGTADTGLTTVPVLPFTMAALAAQNNRPYCYVS